MPKTVKNKKKSPSIKRTGENSYIGKYQHIFNKRWETYEIEALADKLLEWMEKDTKNFWFKDFLIEKRINQRRIAEFCQKSVYFNEVYSICKEIQESRMFKMGASKKFNPAMFIMGLKNNHGWTDKQAFEGENKGFPEFESMSDEQLLKYINEN